MTILLEDLASLVHGRLCGDGDVPIHGAATIRNARAGEITLADDPERANRIVGTQASAVVVGTGFPQIELPAIEVADVHAAFTRIVCHFRPPRRPNDLGVSPAALVHESAQLGPECQVHPTATLGEDVVLGARCRIYPGAHLLAGCRLGDDVTIFPNVVLYENTIVGDRSIIHAGTVIGAHGFGYRTIEGRHQRHAQLGHVEIESDVEIGAATTIDRGAYDATLIGEGTKIDNQVMIAHNCRIGKHNLLCAQAGIAGSCVTGDYVVLAGQVGLCDHLELGNRVQVAAKSGVMHNIPDDTTHMGNPSMPVREFWRTFAAWRKLPALQKQVRKWQRQAASTGDLPSQDAA